jgi:hypothetical protein
VAVAVREAARGVADARGALRAGCSAWLALARDPVVRRIVLLDAPGVVGWRRWREIDQRHSLGAVRASLRRIAGAGTAERGLAEVHAHVLLAALSEVALLIAEADDPDEATARAAQTVNRLLDGLLA